MLTVATRALFPVLKLEDRIAFVLEVPDKALPFNVQVVVQLGSLGLTVNVLLVDAAAATFGDDEAGTVLAIEHEGRILRDQLH